MGAEREDTDPTAKRNGTEPGLGKGSGATPAAAARAPSAPAVEEDAPPPVDFDALHAALGDPLDYVEMGSGPALEKGSETDDLLDALDPAKGQAPTGPGVRVGESSGRSSATYASARPHTIPPTRAPIEDPNAPAVIVATDTDTVPTAPPQMTVPLAASPHAAQFAAPGVAHGAPHPAHVPPGSNPHLGAALGSGPHPASPHPGSGPHPASASSQGVQGVPGAHGSLGVSYPHTPQPIPIQPRGAPQLTMRMPDRPVNARRGKTPTIVVRPRGPSTKQRLLAFMAMLLLVTACGIAVIIWRKPKWLGLDTLGGIPPWGTPTAPTNSGAPPVAPSSGALGAPSASAAAAAGTTGTSATTGTGPIITAVAPTGPAGTASSAAAASASAAAAASASAKKGAKVAPPPATTTAPAHPAGSAPPSSRL